MFICGGQYSTEGSIILLKSFYVILFEYKGPWMLKPDSLIFMGMLNISQHNKFSDSVWRKFG